MQPRTIATHSYRLGRLAERRALQRRTIATERPAAPGVVSPQQAEPRREFHSPNGSLMAGSYLPYYRAYFGAAQLARCPGTGLATGMRNLSGGVARTPQSASASAPPGYAPYWRSFYGAHMQPRNPFARTFKTLATPVAAAQPVQAVATSPASAAALDALHHSLKPQAAHGPSDDEVLARLQSGQLPHHQLENELGDCERAVRLRRAFLGVDTSASFETPTGRVSLPFDKFDHRSFYTQIRGANCENVVGFMTLPVGTVGPLLLDGEELTVPLATSEGALVASTNRGARAISLAGGARSALLRNCMTRAPALRMRSAMDAAALAMWVESPEGLANLQAAFSTTTKFGKLMEIKPVIAGRNIYLRFRCNSGDAMGMNMVSKGVEAALQVVQQRFQGVDVLALSGNLCVDKKPSAINWIDGRGKKVVVEAFISGDIVRDTLKTSVQALAEVNVSKNLIGSALAGSIGGNNAHASNIVTAIYLATGQDPAQNVESSTCITLLEPINGGRDLHASVTMPSIEVGTVGGGTTLPSQAACLQMLGVRGAAAVPGENAAKLARIVAATVLAGEISLMSALSSGHLVSSHMRLNRAPKRA